MFLTKIWFGRHWWYVDTKRKFKHRNFKIIGRWSGIVSYKKGSVSEHPKPPSDYKSDTI